MFTRKPLYQILYLMKLQAAGLQLYCKKGPGADVFRWILFKFQEQPFYRTLSGDYFWLFKYIKGRFIKYVRKIFWKTNSPNPLIVRIRELEMLVFRKILRSYLMDDPKADKNVSRFCNEDIKVASIEATLATLCQLWKRLACWENFENHHKDKLHKISEICIENICDGVSL